MPTCCGLPCVVDRDYDIDIFVYLDDWKQVCTAAATTLFRADHVCADAVLSRPQRLQEGLAQRNGHGLELCAH